ncbi:hypothetical protein DPEC_G00352260 [Dallia pectoralis]|uniref:Uncharacterized protein n=1 Tax=Dallia pectoralis TaxID=75939 RepID=A0ACC2F2E4_DALPE|nr:hypothetical protein DPEC_G00352260 [Dallia pectoralis]
MVVWESEEERGFKFRWEGARGAKGTEVTANKRAEDQRSSGLVSKLPELALLQSSGPACVIAGSTVHLERRRLTLAVHSGPRIEMTFLADPELNAATTTTTSPRQVPYLSSPSGQGRMGAIHEFTAIRIDPRPEGVICAEGTLVRSQGHKSGAIAGTLPCPGSQPGLAPSLLVL